QKYLMIRTDDIGMSHSVNTGLKKLLDTGYPVSVSVMFACPWYQEAVAILKEYENTSIGVHLTLNSEWEHYRWGPVAGREAVPSLVDENGFFFHSSSTLYENQPKRTELEKELRAQIERALASGLDIDYVDYHMGTAMGDPMFREVTENLAKEYKLGLWGYFESNEFYDHYRALPENKIDSLLTMMNRVEPGYSYLVTHVGIDNEELGAMKDMNNSAPLAKMSANRQGELDALTSDAFAKALKENGIKLVTFGDLIDIKGLINMKRPDEEN
ncbi:MAG: ChbG/HpnK family deacetylase, partial [Candidatus Halalkalibacterium sp. M3_1C_030]